MCTALPEMEKKKLNKIKLFNCGQRFKALVEEGSDMISPLDTEELQISKSTNQVVLGIDPKDYIGKMLSIHPSWKMKNVPSQFKENNEHQKKVLNPTFYKTITRREC
jgi:hypothetical protein